MAEIFISYKSERRKAAAHLAKILERYGYTVWFDYHLIKGDDFADEIDRRIREAKAVVVLWCTLAVKSPWVKREAALATKLGRAVPAKIEPCDLRVDFDSDDWIDLSGWNGAPRDHALDKLLEGIAHRVGRLPQLDFKAMRDYEEDWRRFNAPSLQDFALSTPAKAQEAQQPMPISAPVHTVTPAERDWERFGIALSEDAEEIEAYIRQYEAGEPLWAVKAKKRLAALLRERAEAAELARREEAARQEARYRAEGRVRIAAPLVRPPGLEWFLPGAGKTEGFKDADFAPEMVVVPAGDFTMGTAPAEIDKLAKEFPDFAEFFKREAPQVRVAIGKPFAIGRYAITRGEFAAFVNEARHGMSGGAYVWTGKEWKQDANKSWKDPGFAQDDSHPVVCVNWDDAKAYAKWLSAKTGQDYRLPSEAEWEYACRAGTVTPFWWGSSISPEQANYDYNYTYGGGPKGKWRESTVPVKSFEPNPWGLYQVHGNVWEWCEDLWHDNYHGAPEDGSARTTGGGAFRALRGGSCYHNPGILRAASRFGYLDYRFSNAGFRLARTLTP
jgi:formylglycine-generating enzyme required for sulfatase activity